LGTGDFKSPFNLGLVLHPANSRERDKAIKGRILATLDLKKDAILILSFVVYALGFHIFMLII